MTPIPSKSGSGPPSTTGGTKITPKVQSGSPASPSFAASSLVRSRCVLHSTGCWQRRRQRRMRLTEDQARILDSLQSRRRVAVSGGAGTGKTVLAMEKAKRLAHEGIQTLLTCYNQRLASHLADSCAGIENLDVMSFHQLCRRRVKHADAVSGRNLFQEAKVTYPDAPEWDVQWPNALAYTMDAWNHHTMQSFVTRDRISGKSTGSRSNSFFRVRRRARCMFSSTTTRICMNAAAHFRSGTSRTRSRRIAETPTRFMTPCISTTADPESLLHVYAVRISACLHRHQYPAKRRSCTRES